ncbi:MAG TPA: hypothetical protein VEQ60_16995 [Longimicrobium sp.]|nr:hypothetical protein [Longimicrobium sp.]
MSLVGRAVSGARSAAAAPPGAAGSTHLVQTASAGDQGQVSGIHQEMTVLQELPELFVHLTLVEDAAPEVAAAPGGVVRAGARYRVRAEASLNRYIPGTGASSSPVMQTGLRAGRPLVPLPESGPGLEVAFAEGKAAPLTRDGWQGWSYSFELTVSAVAEEEEVHVGLTLCEEATSVVHTAVRVSFVVQGAHPRPPGPIRAMLPLGARPPAGTAFLHVVPYDDERLRLLGWVADVPLPVLDATPVHRPRPKASVDGGGYRQRLADAMNDFAAGEGGKLARWLDAVLAACGDACRIVVVDQDPGQAPWELVKLAGSRVLGAQAPVVRWADLHYRDVRVEIPLDEVTYAGRVAALVDAGEPPSWAAEHLGGDAWEECEELVSALLDRPGPVGVVYLSSRGVFVHGDEDDDVLAGLPSPHGTRELRFDDLEDELEPRPLVFADAPFSGRLLFCGGRGCGMALAAMQRLAAGFVGTLGPVDREFALETGRLFLERARSAEGVCPAELLRELRAAAAGDYGSATSAAGRTEAKRRLLNASMFVFYGGPRVRVHVVPVGGDDA